MTVDIIRTGKYPIAKVSTKAEKQSLVCIADAHCGAANFREDVFKRVVRYCVENKSAVAILGDLIENATKRSVGSGVYDQILTPKDQINKIVELLKPIPKEQFIGAVTGNHEERTYKDSGFDPMMIICDRLDIPYLGAELFAVISRDRVSAYTFYGIHSFQASKTKGLVNNAIERDWFKFIDSDIIAKGHGHDMGLDGPHLSLSVSSQNAAVIEKERYILLAGNYLDRPNSYAAMVPYGPKPCGTVGVWLDMRQHYKGITGEVIR